jgi:hypothetical protein
MIEDNTVPGAPLIELFCIEIKRGYKWDLMPLLDDGKEKRNSNTSLVQSLNQCNEALEHGPPPFLPLLIFKQDRHDIMTATRANFYKGKNILKDCYYINVKCTCYKPLIVMPFEQWLEHVKPGAVHSTLQKQKGEYNGDLPKA